MDSKLACTLVSRPLWHHVAGLQQTASGYGSKLASRYKVRVNDDPRERRVYITCWSNSGTAWFTFRGVRYVVPDMAREGETFEPFGTFGSKRER